MSKLRDLAIEIGLEEPKQWFRPLLEHLRIYRKEQGDCQVPTKYLCSDGYRLGRKLVAIRLGIRGGKGLKPTSEQICKLREIGVIFDSKRDSKSTDASVNIFLRRFQESIQEDGPNLSTSYICSDGYPLGREIRAARKGRKGCGSWKDKITPEVIQRLDEAGFVWEIRKRKTPVEFTKLEIQKYILQYYNEKGYPPNSRSGDSSAYIPGSTNWRAINEGLKKKGTNLVQMYEEMFPKKTITVEDIRNGMLKFYSLHNKFPSQASGDSSPYVNGSATTWDSLDGYKILKDRGLTLCSLKAEILAEGWLEHIREAA